MLLKSSSESMVVSASVAGVAGSSTLLDLPLAVPLALKPPATHATADEVIVRLSAFFAGGSWGEALSLPAAGALRFRRTGDVVSDVGAYKSRQCDDETCTCNEKCSCEQGGRFRSGKLVIGQLGGWTGEGDLRTEVYSFRSNPGRRIWAPKRLRGCCR
jgi:hypothetical protein